MKQTIVLLVMCMPLLINAQEDKGIHFEQGLSWEQIKGKAKAESKYIFVDCYATWCAPCKLMDRTVYPSEKVGNYFNDKFIPIKVQIDSSKKDNGEIKKWYADARYITSIYKVNTYPTFLFFSPNGKLVHRANGAYNEDQFIAISSDALNPKKQYYNLLADYQQGNKDTFMMEQLARSAKLLGDKDIAEKIASDYISNMKEKKDFTKDNLQFIEEFAKSSKAIETADYYISSLTKKELFSPDNIEFISAFTQSSKDKGFKFFFENEKKINNIMSNKNSTDKKFASFLISNIITKEEIDPIIRISGKTVEKEPDWNIITSTITKKYNANNAGRAVIFAKVRWYEFKKDWPKLTNNVILWVEKSNDYNNCEFINRCAWVIFERSNDKGELNTAISWMEKILKKEKNRAFLYYYELDTYANLLYKIGRIKEAIIWEEKAVNPNAERYEENKTTRDKMQKGIPTWPQ